MPHRLAGVLRIGAGSRDAIDSSWQNNQSAESVWTTGNFAYCCLSANQCADIAPRAIVEAGDKSSQHKSMTRPQPMQAGIGAHHMVKLVCPSTSMVVPVEVLRLLQHCHISLQQHQMVSGDADLQIAAFSPECCRTRVVAF